MENKRHVIIKDNTNGKLIIDELIDSVKDYSKIFKKYPDAIMIEEIAPGIKIQGKLLNSFKIPNVPYKKIESGKEVVENTYKPKKISCYFDNVGMKWNDEIEVIKKKEKEWFNAEYHCMGPLGATSIREYLKKGFDLCEINIADQKVLDFGCGKARLREAFPEIREYMGIDISKSLIGIAKQRFPDDKFEEIIDKIPLQDNTIDICLCYSILTHVHTSQVIEILSEINRVLKSNGYLFVSIMDERNLGLYFDNDLLVPFSVFQHFIKETRFKEIGTIQVPDIDSLFQTLYCLQKC